MTFEFSSPAEMCIKGICYMQESVDDNDITSALETIKRGIEKLGLAYKFRFNTSSSTHVEEEEEDPHIEYDEGSLFLHQLYEDEELEES